MHCESTQACESKEAWESTDVSDGPCVSVFSHDVEIAGSVPSVDVLRVADVGWSCFDKLLTPSGLSIEIVPDAQSIPGSHWGDDEAGLITHTLYARSDTPVHSLLHEAGHWLLMDDHRRQSLHTDAKGSAVEEMAVCYLQILMSQQIAKMGQARMLADMDRWGYSFRLGSAHAWIHNDAEDALAYLREKLSHSHRIPGIDVHSPLGGLLQQDNNG